MSWDITVPVPDVDTSSEKSSLQLLVPLISKLYIIFSRILVSLYGQRRQHTTEQLRMLASQLHKDLWQWYQDLPHDFVLTDCDHYEFQGTEVFYLQSVPSPVEYPISCYNCHHWC